MRGFELNARVVWRALVLGVLVAFLFVGAAHARELTHQLSDACRQLISALRRRDMATAGTAILLLAWLALRAGDLCSTLVHHFHTLNRYVQETRQALCEWFEKKLLP